MDKRTTENASGSRGRVEAGRFLADKLHMTVVDDDIFYLDPPFAVFLPTVIVKMLPEQHFQSKFL